MIIFAADLHLRPQIWARRPDIAGDHALAWASLVRATLARPGASLVLGGDVFHNTAPSGAVEYLFKKGMDALLGKGRRVFFIKGNHDDEEVHRASLFGAEQLADGEVVDIGGIKVAAVNHTRVNDLAQERLADAPPCDILVMHTAFRHALGFADMWQCSEEDVPEQVGMVLAGHIHKHLERGKVLIPGSICVNGVDEFDPGDHGYYVVDGGKATWRPLRGRVFLSVEHGDGTAALLDRLGKARHILPPVVNIRHSQDEAGAVEGLAAAHPGTRFMLNARRADLADNLVEEGGHGGLDLEGVVAKAMDELLAGNQEARGLAAALITAQDPSGELGKYLEEKQHGAKKDSP